MGAVTADDAQQFLTAPIGALLLDRLEHELRRQRGEPWRPFDALSDSQPDAVVAAARLAAGLHPTALLRLVLSGAGLVEPWTETGSQNATLALALAGQREPIARAVLARPGLEWAASAAARQWWWVDHLPDDQGPIGRNLGPFPAWATRPLAPLLTTSPVDPTLADALASAWEMVSGPITLWQLRVRPTARVYEVHRPDDWSRLVRAYPEDTSEHYGRRYASWELRDATVADRTLAALLAVPGQRCARRGWRRVLTPNWPAVAADWDGVHLSWLGFLLVEGSALDLGNGDVTMLRGWGSERSAWLGPALGGPEPLPPPPRDGTLGVCDPELQPDRSREAELGWLRRFLAMG